MNLTKNTHSYNQLFCPSYNRVTFCTLFVPSTISAAPRRQNFAVCLAAVVCCLFALVAVLPLRSVPVSTDASRRVCVEEDVQHACNNHLPRRGRQAGTHRHRQAQAGSAATCARHVCILKTSVSPSLDGRQQWYSSTGAGVVAPTQTQ